MKDSKNNSCLHCNINTKQILFLIYSCLWILLPNISFAQTNISDSLEKDLSHHTVQDTAYVTHLNSVAYEFRNKDFEKMHRYANEAITLAVKLKFDAGLAEAYRIMGIYYDRKSEFSTAIEFYQKSIDIFTQLKHKSGLAKCYNNIGNIYRQQNTYEAAISYYQKSLVIAIELNDQIQTAKTYNNIGEVFKEKGDAPKAIAHFEAALLIFEKMKDFTGIPKAYNNIAAVYKMMNETEMAIEYCKKNLVIYDKTQDKVGIMNTYIELGDIYLSVNDLVRAMMYFEKATTAAKALKHRLGTSQIYKNLGYVHLARKEYTKAREYFELALTEMESVQNKSLEAWCYLGLGEVNFLQSNTSVAISFASDAHKLAVELRELALEMRTSELLSKCYAKNGAFAEAYKTHLRFKALSDTLLSADNIKKFTSTYYQYQYKMERDKQLTRLEQQKKDAMKAAEKRRQNILLTFFITGFVLMAALAVTAGKFYLNKKKSNMVLMMQKEEISKKNHELLQLNEEIKAQRDEIENWNTKLQEQQERILEKNDKLREMNDEILAQRDEIELARKELEKKSERIEFQHHKIQDSINYASKIQAAVFPNKNMMNMLMPKHMVYFKPRDVVSGDFYYLKQLRNYTILAAADCTGHGVPGAFMSLLSISLLNDIINNQEITRSDLILNELRTKLKAALNQTGEKGQQHDGMDIALCIIDLETYIMTYSGAHNPLYLFRSEENQNCRVLRWEADKQPVGVHLKEKPFNVHEIQLEHNDRFYIYTDGYHSQFSHQKGAIYRSGRFIKLLGEICHLSFEEQEQRLNQEFFEWKEDTPQTDDILIIGVQI